MFIQLLKNPRTKKVSGFIWNKILKMQVGGAEGARTPGLMTARNLGNRNYLLLHYFYLYHTHEKDQFPPIPPKVTTKIHQ